MKRVYLLVFVFSVLLIGFILKSSLSEKPKVVVVLKELNNNQYWDIVKAGAEKGFQDFGVDGKVLAPSNEYKLDEQNQLLNTILNESPDVLIVSPIDTSIAAALKKFHSNNIPVLLVDTDISWQQKTAYIGTDNLDLGSKGGALLASGLQPGDKVALLTGDVSNPVISDRTIGAKTSLEAAGVEIAVHKTVPNDTKQAKSIMEAILQDHSDIKGVYATTDILAISAVEVIEENQLDILVIGSDGIAEMVQLIEEGTLSETIAQNPYDMGYLSVQTALKLVQGENVERNIGSGVDIITKDNAEDRLDFTRELLR
ncbi:sugar ABC transporter substrate-binding protein [Bacillus taeanensis]|uniref:sugar ABC transporter substrate-binding protein n=1 Tax=Bacillus taeanensis TaxID=273032 RepID=UPI0015F07816|nr:substrate-binding domain-containing protein [Bacillus taeanensis]